MMADMADAYTAERYRSLLLEDIEYLGYIASAANPLEDSYGAVFLSSAHNELDRLVRDANAFHHDVSAPRFKY